MWIIAQYSNKMGGVNLTVRRDTDNDYTVQIMSYRYTAPYKCIVEIGDISFEMACDDWGRTGCYQGRIAYCNITGLHIDNLYKIKVTCYVEECYTDRPSEQYIECDWVEISTFVKETSSPMDGVQVELRNSDHEYWSEY